MRDAWNTIVFGLAMTGLGILFLVLRRLWLGPGIRPILGDWSRRAMDYTYGAVVVRGLVVVAVGLVQLMAAAL